MKWTLWEGCLCLFAFPSGFFPPPSLPTFLLNSRHWKPLKQTRTSSSWSLYSTPQNMMLNHGKWNKYFWHVRVSHATVICYSSCLGSEVGHLCQLCWGALYMKLWHVTNICCRSWVGYSCHLCWGALHGEELHTDCYIVEVHRGIRQDNTNCKFMYSTTIPISHVTCSCAAIWFVDR